MEGACCPVCRLKEVCVDVDAVRTTKVGGLIPNTKLSKGALGLKITNLA